MALPFDGASIVLGHDGRWHLDKAPGQARTYYAPDEVRQGLRVILSEMSEEQAEALRLLAIRRKMGRRRFEREYGARIGDVVALAMRQRDALDELTARAVRRFGYVPEFLSLRRVSVF